MVRKEGLITFFKPAPPDPTFYRWVQEGKVVVSPILNGRYFLNATLKKFGLPEVDIADYEEQESAATKVYRLNWLLFHAVCDLSPPLMRNFPPWCPEPEAYYLEDQTVYEKMRADLQRLMEHGLLDPKGINDPLANVMQGGDIIAEHIAKGEVPMTPRLQELSRGVVLSALPSKHPKEASAKRG